MEHRAANRPWNLLVNVLAASPFLPDTTRRSLYRRGGIDIPSTTFVSPECWFFSDQISIGTQVYINHRCYFETADLVTIGPLCQIASEVRILTSTHVIGPHEQRARDRLTHPVTIGAGCWIGAGATILPGVTIGDGCIIGAGAVVTKDCKPDGIYGGVPAKLIRPA